MENCLACGRHPLNYAVCDRWDCPNLLLRQKQEVPDDLDDVNSDPDAEAADPEDDTIGFPGDPMADWPLDEEEEEEEDEEEGWEAERCAGVGVTSPDAERGHASFDR